MVPERCAATGQQSAKEEIGSQCTACKFGNFLQYVLNAGLLRAILCRKKPEMKGMSFLDNLNDNGQ